MQIIIFNDYIIPKEKINLIARSRKRIIQGAIKYYYLISIKLDNNPSAIEIEYWNEAERNKDFDYLISELSK